MTTLLVNIFNLTISYFFICLNLSFLLNTKRNILIYIIVLIPYLIAAQLNNPIKIIILILIQVLIFYPKIKSLKKTISAVLLNFFILIEIEIISILLIRQKIEILPVIIITNIIINILSHLIIKTKIIKKLWKLIQEELENYLYILIFIFLIISYINYYYQYKELNITIIIIIILLLILSLIKRIIEISTLEKKYNQIIEFITTYEKIIDELRMSQHEYKNNLICLKSMVSKNKKATEFIDSILHEKVNVDSDILREVRKINIKSIVGLTYFKLCQAKEKDIQTIINVSNNLPSKKIEDTILKDLSKIMGILFDNAIDASVETEEKSLSLYVYKENNYVIFQLSNTFKGTINIDLLYKKGFTTKGKNHGYGLLIVKEILKRNKKISLEAEINNNVFTQYLKIKLN